MIIQHIVVRVKRFYKYISFCCNTLKYNTELCIVYVKGALCMKRLKELRAQAGVSQQIVADALGITQQAYANYESGKREPDNDTLLKLAEFFDVTTDNLLNRPSPETKKAPDESGASDADIMFALWGGDAVEITDEMFQDVKNYAQYIKEKKRKKLDKDGD